MGANPPAFLDFACEVLDAAAAGKSGAVASALLENGIIAAAVSNPGVLALSEAIRLARAALRVDDRFDCKILSRLTDSSRHWPNGVPRAEIMRVLKVVDEISDCSRLLIPLMKFLKLPSRHLRSKAVKLLARASRNSTWADSVLGDADPRVRSNLIEGLAGNLGRNAEALLRKATQDRHHRVTVTALLALCRLGDEPSREMLELLKAEGSEAHRRAADWALRQLEQSGQGAGSFHNSSASDRRT